MSTKSVSKILNSSSETEIQIPQKRTYSLEVTLKDSDGTPIDITGWSFTGAVFDSEDQTDQTAFGIIVNADPLTGNFVAILSVLQVDTFSLTKKYRYEINSTDTASNVNDVIVGPACIQERGVI